MAWQRASRLAKIVNYEPGATIYNQGDPPDSFYVVRHVTPHARTRLQLRRRPVAGQLGTTGTTRAHPPNANCGAAAQPEIVTRT